MPGGICTTPECDQLVADAFVCSTCAHRLTVALADVPDLLDELDVDLTRQARRPRQPGCRPPGAEPPLPFDVSASIARDALVSTLRTWCLILGGDVLGTPPADDGPGLAAHLAARLEDIRHHPEGGTCVDEIGAAVTQARDDVHRADRDPSTLAGHCPDCGRAVYARQGAPYARCRADGCPGVVDTATWREWALQDISHRALTATNLVRALTALDHPINLNTVKSWIRRDRLVAVDTDPLGRSRYLVADALNLANPDRKEAS